jgi:hypothetical protein
MNNPPFFKKSNDDMNQEKKIKFFQEVCSELVCSDDVVCASEEEEFFYKDTDASVPYGEPVGMDVPIYDFDFIKYDIDENDNSRDANKLSYNANQEYEALLNDWIEPKEIKLVLFKNVYWSPKYEEE